MIALGGGSDHPIGPSDCRETIKSEDVQKLVAMTLDSELSFLSAHVEEIRAQGVALDSIYLDLMAPAARELGRLWEEDLADFAVVAIALSRLQSLLHEIGSTAQPDLNPSDHAKRVLLAPLPGEQHTFGLAIVMDFFWRAGWDVSGGPIATEHELLRLVRDNWFDVVGLSLGSEKWLSETTAEIRLIRRESRNPAVGILVGGPVFSGHPERVALVGADGWADDARAAPQRAEILLAELEGRRSHAPAGKYF
jgi:methanogenic corrinoid protein MtbC1